MAEYAVNLNNGATDEKGQFRLLGKLLNQSGVIESTGLTVSATTPTPDMTVKVSGSVANDNAVFITTTGDTYHGWNTTSPYSVTILSNSTGVTHYDAIVAYIDTAAGGATANNPGGLKFLAVRSSATDGVTKTTSADIAASAVGTKPYMRLADVTVGNSVSSINSGNIVDARLLSRLGSGLVLPTSRSGGFKAGAFTTNASTGNQAITGVGFKPKLVRFSYLAPSSGVLYDDYTKGMEGVMDEFGAQQAKAYYQHTNFQTKSAAKADASLYMISHAGGAITNTLLGTFVSMDADGFTVNLSVAAAFYLRYEAVAELYMPPRRDPLNGAEENHNIYTEIALITEKVNNLYETIKVTAADVRTLKDANFLTTRDFQALFEKLQGTFIARREYDELDSRVAKIEGYVAKGAGIIVLAVLSSLLALVLKSNGILH